MQRKVSAESICFLDSSVKKTETVRVQCCVVFVLC